jgi:hypothetical protein
MIFGLSPTIDGHARFRLRRARMRVRDASDFCRRQKKARHKAGRKEVDR